MRGLVLVGLTLVGALCAAQQPPPDGKCSWLLSESDTVLTIVDVVWTWREKETYSASDMDLSCTNWCQGKKHLLHEQCDLSCDVACEYRHRGTLWPTYYYVVTEPPMANVFTQFGVPGDVRQLVEDVREATRQSIRYREYCSDPKNSVPFDFRHWNKKPCSHWNKYHDEKLFIADVTYSLKRVNTMPDGSRVETKGPSKTEKVEVSAPVPGTFKDAEKPRIACACSIVETSDDYGLLLDDGGQPTGVACVHDGHTELLGGQQVIGLGLTFVGQDMNDFTVSVTNKPPGCDRLTIPAGFEFVCADGSAQDVLQVRDVTIEFAEGSNVGYLASIDPSRDFVGWLRAQAETRTLCLDIAKREPSPAKKYFLAMPRDPGTLRLARMTRDSRFTGPWDQVRLWIYTDRASLDEIGKVLVPGPSPRMYLRELHTLAKERLIRLDPKEDAKIVDDRLLTAFGPDPEALQWFVAWKLRHQPDSTLRFVRSSGKALAAHFKDEDPAEAAATVMGLAAAVSSLGGDAGTAAVLDMLADKALAPHAAALASSPASGSFLAALARTTDPALAGRLLDFVEAQKPAGRTVACLNANPALPEAVRLRAASLAG
jgi:hypothetical protein